MIISIFPDLLIITIRIYYLWKSVCSQYLNPRFYKRSSDRLKELYF